jgi:hypothetical protein
MYRLLFDSTNHHYVNWMEFLFFRLRFVSKHFKGIFGANIDSSASASNQCAKLEQIKEGLLAFSVHRPVL